MMRVVESPKGFVRTQLMRMRKWSCCSDCGFSLQGAYKKVSGGAGAIPARF